MELPRLGQTLEAVQKEVWETGSMLLGVKDSGMVLRLVSDTKPTRTLCSISMRFMETLYWDLLPWFRPLEILLNL